MEFKDLEKKLENIETPEIEIQSHKQRLKAALLTQHQKLRFGNRQGSGYFWNKIMLRRLVPVGVVLALVLVVGFSVIQPKLQIARAMEIAKNDPQIQRLIEDYGLEIKQVKLQDGKAYVLLALPEEKLPPVPALEKGIFESEETAVRGYRQMFIAYQDTETGEIKEFSGSVAEIDLKKKKVGKLEMVETMKINLTPLTEEEKARAIEIAKSDPKIQEMIPDLEQREVIVKPLPPLKLRLDEDPDNGMEITSADPNEEKRVNVIFKSDEMQDIITVNLTTEAIEGAVSYRQGGHISPVNRPAQEGVMPVPLTPEITKKLEKAIQITEQNSKIQQLTEGMRYTFKLGDIKKHTESGAEWTELVLRGTTDGKDYLIKVNLADEKVESIQALKPVEIHSIEEPQIRIKPAPVEIPDEKEIFSKMLEKIAQKNDELKQILKDNDYEILDIIKSKPIVEKTETSETIRVETATVLLEKESTGKKYWITIDLGTNTVKSIKRE